MKSISLCITGLLLLCLGAPALAVTELSGTLTREEDGSVIDGHAVGVTRWVVAAGTPAGEAIPVEWSVNSDATGAYRFDLDESLPGMDQLLVFTSDQRVFNELYPAVDMRGVEPKGADIVEPGVTLIDLAAGVQTGIDFVVASSETAQMVPMTDGTQLDTRVYLPSRRPGMQWPVLLHRTPYNIWGPDGFFMRGDYALVNQNTRGRYASEGVDSVFDADGWLTHKDGYDTVKWIAAQPFYKEGICTHGKSAPGLTGYLLAGTTPEELVCVFAEVAGGNQYHDYYYPGGVFRKHMIETWMTENNSLPKLAEIKAHPNEDTYWNDRNMDNRFSLIGVPMLHYAGWYDIVGQGTIDVFTGLQEGGAQGARRNQKLVVGPWTHDTTYTYPVVGELTYPEVSNFLDARPMSLDWFNFWLKAEDNGIMDTPAVRAYVMGPGSSSSTAGNFWRTSATWPPPYTETAYYLQSGGTLSTSPPTAASADTNYVSDPNNPVPTTGGNNLYDDYGQGPTNQRSVDNRSDVLVWESAPLSAPLEISGPIKLILHASSDQLDTDWVVKLEDSYSNNKKMLVTDLVLQARHRIGFDREDLLTPGQVYEFEIELWDTSLTFDAGHEIRIAIASSNYPRFEMNPQTGEPFDQHTGMNVATNRVYHDAARPSRLILPVVDTETVAGCAATEHVTGLAMSRVGSDVSLQWNGVSDACHARYRVFAGKTGPQWPWIVRRPLLETTATNAVSSDDGVFWQVVVEGSDGGNGPHGVP